jgi:hypothetical protein
VVTLRKYQRLVFDCATKLTWSENFTAAEVADKEAMEAQSAADAERLADQEAARGELGVRARTDPDMALLARLHGIDVDAVPER